MREEITKILHLFMLIYLFFTLDLAVLSGLGITPEVTLDINWGFGVLIRSAMYTVPVVVFKSKRELSVSEMVVRRVVHFLLIEIIVMSNEFFWDGIKDIKTLSRIALSVLVVYMFVAVGDWLLGYMEAQRMNRMLERIKGRNIQ